MKTITHSERTSTLRLLRVIAFGGISLTSAVCSAQMYKCVDAEGSSTFSDKPCGPNAQVHVVHQQPQSAGFSGSVSSLQSGPVYHSPDAPVGVPSGAADPYGVRRANRSVVIEKQKVIIEKKIVVVEKPKAAQQKSSQHKK